MVQWFVAFLPFFLAAVCAMSARHIDRALASAQTLLPRRIPFVAARSSSSSLLSSTHSLLPTSTTARDQESNILHAPPYFLFPPERIPELMRWKEVTRIGAGLSNMGNTCFLNAVLQCLTHTPPLANYFLTSEHSRSCRSHGFCALCEVEAHVSRAFRVPLPSSPEAVNRAITPKNIVHNMRNVGRQFRLGCQEDAHEFLRLLIEQMQKAALRGTPERNLPPRVPWTTLVAQCFGGFFQSTVTCLECNYESNTFDPFLDLSLEITHADSVVRALRRFTSAEILDGGNKYKCSKCGHLVPARKQLSIRQAPNVLCIHLKRFAFSSFMGGKINKMVNFDNDLDITRFMSHHTADHPTYELYGVLVHVGHSQNSGHYYSFVKGSNGVWCLMDDAQVRQVSLQTVLRQQAYILFYIRTQPRQATRTHLVSPTTTPSSRETSHEALIRQDSSLDFRPAPPSEPTKHLQDLSLNSTPPTSSSSKPMPVPKSKPQLQSKSKSKPHASAKTTTPLRRRPSALQERVQNLLDRFSRSKETRAKSSSPSCSITPPKTIGLVDLLGDDLPSDEDEDQDDIYARDSSSSSSSSSSGPSTPSSGVDVFEAANCHALDAAQQFARGFDPRRRMPTILPNARLIRRLFKSRLPSHPKHAPHVRVVQWEGDKHQEPRQYENGKEVENIEAALGGDRKSQFGAQVAHWGDDVREDVVERDLHILPILARNGKAKRRNAYDEWYDMGKVKKNKKKKMAMEKEEHNPFQGYQQRRKKGELHGTTKRKTAKRYPRGGDHVKRRRPREEFVLGRDIPGEMEGEE